MRQETELRHSHINTQHTTTTSPAVVPVHTGNHLSAIAVCRVGNTLTAKNNKNNDNAVVIPTHYTRYTMGPRVREDDKIRDRKRLIDQSYKEEVGVTKMRQDTSTAPLSHKHSAHSRHAPSRHSRAHGKPFIHTHRMPRLEMHLPQ